MISAVLATALIVTILQDNYLPSCKSTKYYVLRTGLVLTACSLLYTGLINEPTIHSVIQNIATLTTIISAKYFLNIQKGLDT